MSVFDGTPLKRSRNGLAFRCIERPGRPWCVLTHGAFMSHETFARLLAPLSERHSLLLWDLPGHGASDLPLSPRLSQAAESLCDLLDELGIDRTLLIGHSFGGMVSQEFIRLHPHRVSGFLAYGCVANHLQKLPAPGLVSAWTDFQFRLRGAQRFTRQFVQQCSADAAVQTQLDSSVRAQVSRLRRPIWHAMIHAARWQPDYRFPCPVAHLRGAQDTRFTGAEAAMNAFAAAIAPQPAVQIARAGHCAHLDQPLAFERAMPALLRHIQPESA